MPRNQRNGRLHSDPSQNVRSLLAGEKLSKTEIIRCLERIVARKGLSVIQHPAYRFHRAAWRLLDHHGDRCKKRGNSRRSLGAPEPSSAADRS